MHNQVCETCVNTQGTTVTRRAVLQDVKTAHYQCCNAARGPWQPGANMPGTPKQQGEQHLWKVERDKCAQQVHTRTHVHWRLVKERRGL